MESCAEYSLLRALDLVIEEPEAEQNETSGARSGSALQESPTMNPR
jgi:hypothetical protein